MGYTNKPFDPKTPNSLSYVPAKHVINTLARVGGNLESAAKTLGMSGRSLRGRLPAFGIYIKENVLVWTEPFPSKFKIVQKEVVG